MLVLCLDTSTPDVAAGVVDTAAGGAWAAVERDPRGAGELLMPLVRAALADAGRSLGDLEAIAVGLGPGPYTGLRVGVVTAATLGLALGVPAYGAISLDVWAAPDVTVTTDARRREVYWASYGPSGERVDGPHVSKPAEVPTDRRVVGPGAALYPDVLGDHVAGPVPVARLAALVDLEGPTGPLVPAYLRRPDAAEPRTGTAAEPRTGTAAEPRTGTAAEPQT